MKRVLTVLVVAGLSFGTAYWLVSSRKDARLKRELAAREAAWQAEKANLEEALAAASIKPGQVRTTTAYVTKKESPQAILDKLITINPRDSEETRNQTLRRIVHELQRLEECGTEALPVIKLFLARNKDVDYAAEDIRETGERGGRAERTSFATFNPARTDFLAPPSLRLGLLDVLKQIGGAEAERILAETLATTGRGVEVAYLTRILAEMAPDKYRDAALSAAKDLLTNPPPIDSPNRLDDNARAYLYAVLAMYNDTSFVGTAQNKLVTPDGRIDRSALNYLSGLLKEQALPAMYAAYKDARLTNQWEKSALLTLALNYVGSQPQANDMFAETIVNESVPTGLRAFTVQSLAGGWRADTPRDPQLIQARVQLLENLKRDVKDERIARALDETTRSLQKLLQPDAKPPQ